MAPLPKRRTSKARKGNRRAHQRAYVASLVRCPRCHSAKIPHRVCPTCGTYAGREVIEV